MYKNIQKLGVLLSGLFAGMTGTAGASGAGEPAGPSYGLARPVPAAELRAMSTDRPDQTESPYTVDAGHFQIELEWANGTFDHDTTGGADMRTTEWSLLALNLKVGLSDRIDLQFLVNPRESTRTQDRLTGAVSRTSGFGDVTTRLKLNFWGNDGGRTAFGVMPFVKWPLASSGVRNGELEGGVIFPFGMELAGGVSLGAMTEVAWVSDSAGGYDVEWLNSVTFSRSLGGKLGGYVEFVVVTGNAPGFKWRGQLDVGFTYAVSDNVQWDAGCNFGVTRAAPDYQPFTGVSRRF